MAQLKVTQVRSTIGNKRPARESVRSLGLKRIHHSVVVDGQPGEPRLHQRPRPTCCRWSGGSTGE